MNPIKNKCDPGDPGTPHLTIVKSAPDPCTTKSNDGQVSVFDCVFTITITNDGTAPANNIPVIDTPNKRGDLGTIVGVESDGSWNCGVSTNTSYNWLTDVTCQRPSALEPGNSTYFKVTLEVVSTNRDPNPNPGRPSHL